jgi:hypothetical protein
MEIRSSIIIRITEARRNARIIGNIERLLISE